QVDDHLSARQFHEVGFGRDGEPGDVLRPNDVVLRLERARGASYETEPMPFRIDDRGWRDAVAAVLRIAAEDLDGDGERLPASERLHDVRVARARHLTLVPFASDEDRILTRPRHALLAFGEIEPVLHE